MLYREPSLKDEHKAQFEAELVEKARLETERVATEEAAKAVSKTVVEKKVKKPRKK